MAEYTIRICNETSDENSERTYFFYSEPPDVSGAGVSQAVPVLMHVSQPLRDNAQDSFKISSKFWGFVGKYSSDKGLKVGNEISLIHKYPVELGKNGTGSQLLVQQSDRSAMFITPHGDRSESGTFTISCTSNIRFAENYVVGLARKVANSFVPAAAVQCEPRATFVFKPKAGLYISRFESYESYDSGTIISRSRPAARLNLGSKNPIEASEKPGGKFDGLGVEHCETPGYRSRSVPSERSRAMPKEDRPDLDATRKTSGQSSKSRHGGFGDPFSPTPPIFLFGVPQQQDFRRATSYPYAPEYRYGPKIAFFSFSAGPSWM
ncbi:Fc.00g104640.m01.CDS01 [Cosmosporella sp. VM-42]